MKLTLRQIRQLILLLFFGIFIGSIGYELGQKKISWELKGYLPEVKIERALPAGKEKVDFKLFWEVWDKVSNNHLENKSFNQAEMVYGAISGMVSSLKDPYTVFLPPTENKQSKEDLSGFFEGVGIQLGYKEERLAVIAPLAGTPADRAGVRAGDFILKITDEKKKIERETTGLSLPEAVTIIRGPMGTSVKLTLGRENAEEPVVVELKREKIFVKSAEVEFIELEGKIVAHIKLSRFGERTIQEWEEVIDQLKKVSQEKKDSFSGIALDLRNNPGGILDVSVSIASEFLSDGVVVQQDDGESRKKAYSVNRKGELLTEPLVVLINEGSASASEIVAGALKERRKGTRLVGETTFGKGTIQEAEDLPGGSGLHITVARWLLPSGKSIDDVGVSPDFIVKADEEDQTKDLQLAKAIELLTK